MPDVFTIFFALLGGILPALLWLWFWLGEDRLHPEPRRLLFASFLFGMFSVILALPLENYSEILVKSTFGSTAIVIISWAIIEEVLKFWAAYFGGIHKKDCDEPLDPMIYLITAALGFSAAENTLFLLNENLLSGLVTGNLRFIGASLLHVLASGALGYFMAISFYKKRSSRILYAAIGIIAAVTVHSLFNYFIMQTQSIGTFMIFSFVWIAIVVLLLAFERIKLAKTGTD